MELSAAKSAFRQEMLAMRDAIPAKTRVEWSAMVDARLRERLGDPQHKHLVMTLAIGSEWLSDSFAQYWLDGGGVLVLPRVIKGQRTLELRRVTDLQRDLVLGVWGIREPSVETTQRVEPASLDMIVVPGLAFDDAGYRLGYGGGFFDALLSAAVGAQPIGAGFACQRVRRVPRELWDVPVTAFVSERGVEDFQEKAVGSE